MASVGARKGVLASVEAFMGAMAEFRVGGRVHGQPRLRPERSQNLVNQ